MGLAQELLKSKGQQENDIMAEKMLKKVAEELTKRFTNGAERVSVNVHHHVSWNGDLNRWDTPGTRYEAYLIKWLDKEGFAYGYHYNGYGVRYMDIRLPR